MAKLHNLLLGVVLVAPLALAAVIVGQACTPTQQAKFANAADLVCKGLEDFEVLHNEILSIDLLMQRGDYKSALKVAYELAADLDQSADINGAGELRALILLLEGIVKDTHNG